MLHPDHERVQALLRGDQGAAAWYEQVVTCIPRMVQQVVRRYPWLAPHRQDLAQQAFLVVAQSLARYHGLASFEAWIQRSCELTVMGRARQERRGPGAPLDATGEPADTARPEDPLVEAERNAALRRAVDAIGGVEAEILRQVFFEGLDFETIAQRTGMAIAALRTRFYRALKRLRLRLSPPPGASDEAP